MSPLDPQALEAALRAFRKGPPGVLRRMVSHDSTPPDYERLGTTFGDERRAIAEAIEAYLEHVGEGT